MNRYLDTRAEIQIKYEIEKLLKEAPERTANYNEPGLDAEIVPLVRRVYEIDYNPVRVVCPQCEGRGRWPEGEDYPDDCPMCSGQMTILLVPVPPGTCLERKHSYFEESGPRKLFNEAWVKEQEARRKGDV